MLVDSPRRRAYLPRTIAPRSERLYSGRSQSLSSDLDLFINLSLRPGGQAGTDDTEKILLLRMGDDQMAAISRDAERKEALFRV